MMCIPAFKHQMYLKQKALVDTIDASRTPFPDVPVGCIGADRTLRIAVNMVTKALLQYLMLLAPDPDFPELWSRILQVLQVVSLFQAHLAQVGFRLSAFCNAVCLGFW